MYDPVLGRFIQADSIVQDPFDPQSLNRYAYVLNNPLSATDPSGNISFKNALKLGISIGIAVATSGAATALIAEKLYTAAVVITAFGGAAAATVAVGPKGAVRGAITSLVFFGVGQGASALQGAKGSLSYAAFAENGLGRAALHGIAGGAIASLSGGNFGHGFVTAGVGKAVTSRAAITGNDYTDGAIAALVGGTLSEASGDSFTNGALTGAMQFAFNQLFGSSADDFDPEKCRNLGCADPTRLQSANQTVAEGFSKTADVIDELAVDQVKYAWLGPLAGHAAKFDRWLRGVFRFGKVTQKAKVATKVSRPLTTVDLGIKGTVQDIRGTFALSDGVATIRVDMIRGELQNPLQVVNNMVGTARASGATTLRIEGTIANERLFNILQQRYGLTSIGAIDSITIPLR